MCFAFLFSTWIVEEWNTEERLTGHNIGWLVPFLHEGDVLRVALCDFLFLNRWYCATKAVQTAGLHDNYHNTPGWSDKFNKVLDYLRGSGYDSELCCEVVTAAEVLCLFWQCKQRIVNSPSRRPFSPLGISYFLGHCELHTYALSVFCLPFWVLLFSLTLLLN